MVSGSTVLGRDHGRASVYGALLDELKALPEVPREGVAPHKVKGLIDL
jgi:hypothetical protein